MNRVDDYKQDDERGIGRWRPEQIAQRRTWDRLSDPGLTVPRLNQVRLGVINGTTVTQINPLDTGDGVDSDVVLSPTLGTWGQVIPAGRY